MSPMAPDRRSLLAGCGLGWTLAGATAWVAAGKAWAQPARQAVEFVVDMRDEIAAGRFDPRRDSVGLRGAVPPLQWGSSLRASAAPGLPGRYTLQLDVDPAAAGGQAVQHKFKIDSPGRPDAGWEPGRNRGFVVAAPSPTALRVERVFGTDASLPPPQRTGQIERIAPQPSAFVTPREVQVWLPPGYAQEPTRRYPVLYMHDGQNLFDNAAAGAEWQVDETAQRLVLAGTVAPMIVVGVSSTDSRSLDYTPYPFDDAGARQGGGAARYGRYLVEELKPLIDTRYRTLPGRDSTAVGGSSFGGLVTMWLLLQHAPTFGSGLVVSPSVWVGRNAIVAQVRNAALTLPPPRVWLDMGGREGPGALQGARALRDAVQARGWPLHYMEASAAGHDEAAWAARVEGMLRTLYPPTAR